MKYKVVANQTIIVQEVSALKAMNAVLNLLTGNTENLDIKVYYLSGSEWKLENQAKVKGQ